MVKPTTRSVSGTSFWGHTITTTYANITKLFGKPEFLDDKVQFMWSLEDDTKNIIFTIYDWIEIHPIHNDDEIVWHIDALCPEDSDTAFELLSKML